MEQAIWQSNLLPYEWQNFSLHTLSIDSRQLKKNPLGDSPRRFNPVLVPKRARASSSGKKNSRSREWPLVVILSGLGGNGPKSFAPKTFEENLPQVIDRTRGTGKAPEAVYLFVDAMTFWGGSQFLDSPASGNYESFLMKEVLPSLEEQVPLTQDPERRCVAGHSSGGYGALHLASRYPKIFGQCVALAPDSDFPTSLLPDLYVAAPWLKKLGVNGIKKELQEGKLFRRKDGFRLQLAVAMAACYSSERKLSSRNSFPIDLNTGELKKDIWRDWLAKDPVVFLPKRKKALQKLHGMFLDVGCYDQFHLAFGCRKMRDLLQEMKAPLTYQEFEGNHFDTLPRWEEALKWLARAW